MKLNKNHKRQVAERSWIRLKLHDRGRGLYDYCHTVTVYDVGSIYTYLHSADHRQQGI